MQRHIGCGGGGLAFILGGHTACTLQLSDLSCISWPARLVRLLCHCIDASLIITKLFYFFCFNNNSFIESKYILGSYLTVQAQAGTLTNVGNPAEDPYRRSAIGKGRKVIYVGINS